MKDKKIHKLYDRISTMREYELLYYDNRHHDQLAVLLIYFKKLGLYVKKEVFELIVNRRIINKKVTPISYARMELKKLEAWSSKTKILAKKAKLSWKELSNQFITNITTDQQKKEIFEVSETNVKRNNRYENKINTK